MILRVMPMTHGNEAMFVSKKFQNTTVITDGQAMNGERRYDFQIVLFIVSPLI